MLYCIYNILKYKKKILLETFHRPFEFKIVLKKEDKLKLNSLAWSSFK